MLIALEKVCQFFQNMYSFVHISVESTSSTQVKHLKLTETAQMLQYRYQSFEDQVGRGSSDDCLFGDDFRSVSTSSSVTE